MPGLRACKPNFVPGQGPDGSHSSRTPVTGRLKLATRGCWRPEQGLPSYLRLLPVEIARFTPDLTGSSLLL